MTPNRNFPPLPSEFIKRIKHIYEKSGESWLNQLPDLRTQILERWKLKGGIPILPLSYNYLELVQDMDGNPAVLKLGFPNPEFITEILTLQIYQGRGAVRLIKGDPEFGALLLEQILPGTNLLAIKDDQEAMRIGSQVMRRIWMEATNSENFPTMLDWCRGLKRYRKLSPASSRPLPERMVNQAEDLAQVLLQTQAPSFLLHGDLHHMNILQGENGSWIVIDPKGVIGEPCFEIGPLMINPLPDLIKDPQLTQTLSRRLDILEQELQLDRWRMAAWCFVRAVLSAVWEVEDGGENWQYGITCAEHLLKLIP